MSANFKTFRDFSTDLPDAIVRCPFEKCHARIIRLNQTLKSSVTEIKNAPEMWIHSDKFYVVPDVWDFDNIGVSKPSLDLQNSSDYASIGKIERLLICSECDKGPIGFAGFTDKQEVDVKKLTYYLSCASVKYEI